MAFPAVRAPGESAGTPTPPGVIALLVMVTVVPSCAAVIASSDGHGVPMNVHAGYAAAT